MEDNKTNITEEKDTSDKIEVTKEDKTDNITEARIEVTENNMGEDRMIGHTKEGPEDLGDVVTTKEVMDSGQDKELVEDLTIEDFRMKITMNIEGTENHKGECKPDLDKETMTDPEKDNTNLKHKG